MISVIVPTYNERENLPILIERVFDIFNTEGIDGEVVVVDDNSPDGTAYTAIKLKDKYNIQVIVRKDKKGLSSAVLDGFKKAKNDILCVMDADLSHPPEIIPKLCKKIEEGADFVLASRYVKDGGTKNWSLKRKTISRSAGLIACLLTDVKDPMSGFFALRRKVIEGVDLSAKGYKIGLEILVKGKYNKIAEVPFIFKDRQHGESKLGRKVMKEYISQAFDLYLWKWKTLIEFVKFCIVGALGTLVNLVALYSLVEFANVWYIIAGTIAFVIAVLFNFTLNKIWTFANKVYMRMQVTKQLTEFLIVCVIGLCLNLFALYLLVEYMEIWYIFSQIAAILIATIWNYVGSKYWVFQSKAL